MQLSGDLTSVDASHVAALNENTNDTRLIKTIHVSCALSGTREGQRKRRKVATATSKCIATKDSLGVSILMWSQGELPNRQDDISDSKAFAQDLRDRGYDDVAYRAFEEHHLASQITSDRHAVVLKTAVLIRATKNFGGPEKQIQQAFPFLG
ncbi:hypothetical protein AC579_5373 [Pseudocercospora musae]|uniref:Uncharacterized protein n=1 Tax=Pseudocercospora musae TaxID=113226 RepID=A0A139H3Y0_9PEZI|nr:hypothetical protein AC579_5373 [Pseudocercospora musae]